MELAKLASEPPLVTSGPNPADFTSTSAEAHDRRMLRVFGRALLLAISCLSCGAPRPASDVAIRNEAPPPDAEYAPVYFSSNAQAPIVQHGSASIPVTAADPQWGDPLAPVTIVEF